MRDILDSEKTIKNLIFDTTGIGYFEAGKNAPDLETLNKVLVEQRVKTVKVSKLAEVDVAKAEAVFEVQVAGLG